nr:hypothetical protein [Tanacetum cinerariifolium]
EMINTTDDDKSFTPKPRPEEEELSSDEDLDDWLKLEMERHMCGQDKEDKEDALVAILQSLVGEYDDIKNEKEGISRALPCQLPPKKLNPRSFTLPCTIGSFNFYAMKDLGTSLNSMPVSIFEHLKLANLKKPDMLVEMTVMTKKAPLGIVGNEMINTTDDDKSFTPKPRPAEEELSSDEDLDDWLKLEMERHMCGQYKEDKEDALVAILQSLVGECKAVYANKGSQIETSSIKTNDVQGCLLLQMMTLKMKKKAFQEPYRANYRLKN